MLWRIIPVGVFCECDLPGTGTPTEYPQIKDPLTVIFGEDLLVENTGVEPVTFPAHSRDALAG